MASLLVLSLVAVCFVPGANAWQNWDFYNINVTDWNPGARRGHSMHLWNNSVYLFGGRGNDIQQEHIPRTYEIVTINGTLQFSTYDKKPVQEACVNVSSPDCQSTIPLGTMMNDIWEYPLDCVRWSDLSCRMEGWKVIDPGAILGGCAIQGGIETCTHPTERWEHTSAMFDDGTLIVYGGFSQRCEDFCSDVWRFEIGRCKEEGHIDSSACKWTELSVLGRSGPGKRWRSANVREGNVIYLFGGHRLWHGFGVTNSVENKWVDSFQYAFGGYMDDLWQYNYPENTWTQIPRIQSCFPNPGIEWKDRFNLHCVVFWPPQRAGAAMLYFNETLLVHGGYRTFFPYPHTNARGAGPGTATIGSDGFSPYPTYPFYLDDLWKYSFDTGKWVEITPSSIKPDARTEHSIIISGDVFILFGGYRSNYYFGDLWLYNITTNTWLEKSEYVHALYPANCTEDTVQVNGLEVIRSHSVWGQPTRFAVIDGLEGRSGQHVFVQQARRRAPGWDGCRDRLDGRLDLPVALQWLRPAQRSGHRSIYSPKHRLMLVYGGLAYQAEQQRALDITHPTVTVGDMWQHHLDHCPKNCSQHGDCFHGYCYCHDGYYGIDCSNMTCPGSYCWMNTDNHQQICRHCCHAGYSHTDGEWYKEDHRKVPCNQDDLGEMHGICDGFGNCQCEPPFMTRDCSVRDCPSNCSYNGWCDIQYPVGRCICDAGWIGKDCSERVCLNNCSYPNGECDSGTCICAMTYNPFNNTRTWRTYAGDDCSFVVPFAAASFNKLAGTQLLLIIGLVWVLWQRSCDRSAL